MSVLRPTTDGLVTIRSPRIGDSQLLVAGAQMDWLWMAGEREAWQAMTTAEQRAHALLDLEMSHEAFAAGPKWTFAVDAVGGAAYVARVDGDLANEHVPPGEANISYSSHPAHRGRGHVSRAVRLLMKFLTEHTGARFAHLIIDEGNSASRRVAAAVGARPTERWTTNAGRVMIRYVCSI